MSHLKRIPSYILDTLPETRIDAEPQRAGGRGASQRPEVKGDGAQVRNSDCKVVSAVTKPKYRTALGQTYFNYPLPGEKRPIKPRYPRERDPLKESTYKADQISAEIVEGYRKTVQNERDHIKVQLRREPQKLKRPVSETVGSLHGRSYSEFLGLDITAHRGRVSGIKKYFEEVEANTREEERERENKLKYRKSFSGRYDLPEVTGQRYTVKKEDLEDETARRSPDDLTVKSGYADLSSHFPPIQDDWKRVNGRSKKPRPRSSDLWSDMRKDEEACPVNGDVPIKKTNHYLKRGAKSDAHKLERVKSMPPTVKVRTYDERNQDRISAEDDEKSKRKYILGHENLNLIEEVVVRASENIEKERVAARAKVNQGQKIQQQATNQENTSTPTTFNAASTETPCAKKSSVQTTASRQQNSKSEHKVVIVNVNQSEPNRVIENGTRNVKVGEEETRTRGGHSQESQKSAEEYNDSEEEPPPPLPPKPPKKVVEKLRNSGLNSSQSSLSSATMKLEDGDDVDGGIFRTNSSLDADSGTHSPKYHHFVVVAVDFGTTFSGYAFSFTRDPDSNIYIMRKWEGSDPWVVSQKTPTALLLTPDREFHSFGYSARDHYHNTLEESQSRSWLYFDKFKMALHYNEELNRDTLLQAANGEEIPALEVFAHSLLYFRKKATQEVSQHCGTSLYPEDVCWVITVPAIWRQAAKQFMREAAYMAGLGSPESPRQVLIALEPEAAAIYCRKLKLNQLIPERSNEGRVCLPIRPPDTQSILPAIQEETQESLLMCSCDSMNGILDDDFTAGTRYVVVDCGGGTVDITVHEVTDPTGCLKEVLKATGGPHGAMGVDLAFEAALVEVFGQEFISRYKASYPGGWIGLMSSWEARKRSASQHSKTTLNVRLPFSFILQHRKWKKSEVHDAIKKSKCKGISWSDQGMLRLDPIFVLSLFEETTTKIKEHIRCVLEHPEVMSPGLRYLFLVGGFAESAILQDEVRKEFGDLVRVIIPQGVSLTILRGAVMFGLDPSVVRMRRSRLTYGVGVLRRYKPSIHPRAKCIERDGIKWCSDVFDVFVRVDQSVSPGDSICRSYQPAKPGQNTIIINIYSTESQDVQFVTDPGVQQVGTLRLDISDTKNISLPHGREVQTRFVFGDTEIHTSALDLVSGRHVLTNIDFLNL